MITSPHDYEEVYKSRTWAYSDKPDQHLIKALVDQPRGRALDLGGGQGRHALALSALGYDVTLVDSASTGLHQASEAAETSGLILKVRNEDAARFEPEPGLSLAVAALFFHIPARRTTLKIAEKVGNAMESGGLLYLSVPGFNRETEQLFGEVFEAAGCSPSWVIKHLVTKKERPRLPVSRRNETRGLGIRV